MTRNTITHIARGADAGLFFQWRASRSGAEKFHSAMVPHAGPGSALSRELVELGAAMKALGPVLGSVVHADVALLWDWESFWAQDLEWRPSIDLDHRERIVAFYTRLWRDHHTVDFAHPAADLDRYRLVVVPQLYLLDQVAANNLTQFVGGGGQLLVSYFSGVVDGHDAVHPQGLSGPLGDLLGVSVQEFAPLREHQCVTLKLLGDIVTADVWTDRLALADPETEILGTFTDGPAAGLPALTRRPLGRGAAWYLATRLDIEALAPLMDSIYAAAGLGKSHAAAGLETVTRRTETGTFHFLINHNDHPVQASVFGTDLLTGIEHQHGPEVPAGQVVVIQQTSPNRWTSSSP
jgi:beta-galactosidase